MISVQSVVFALIIKTDNVETDVIATGVLDSTGSDWDPVVSYCKHDKEELYIRVTVHCNRFLFNNQPHAVIIQIYSVIKLYMFRASSLPIIRSSLLYIRHS